MGFFETLRHVLGRDHVEQTSRLEHAWGLDESEEHSNDGVESGEYDRSQWHKKMKRILGELPESKDQWAELLTEGKALQLDADWVRKCEWDEFKLLVRRAISDRHFTEQEHRKLDLARDLIGIPNEEAEAILHEIIAEAESFFGKPIEES